MTQVVPFKADLPAERFSYAALDRNTEVAAREDAALIKDRLRRTAEDIVEIGRALVRQRTALKGHFLAWVQGEFEMSQRTAYNFIAVAERLGDKVATVASLAPRALYELASPSTPEVVVKEVMALAVSGESVTATDIARMRDEERAKVEAAERERKKAQREKEAAEERAKQAEAEASRLKATAVDTAKKTLDERLKKQLEEAKAEAERNKRAAERALDDAMEELKLRGETQRRLNELERDLARQKEKTNQALDDAMEELRQRQATQKELKAAQEKLGQVPDAAAPNPILLAMQKLHQMLDPAGKAAFAEWHAKQAR